MIPTFSEFPEILIVVITLLILLIFLYTKLTTSNKKLKQLTQEQSKFKENTNTEIELLKEKLTNESTIKESTSLKLEQSDEKLTSEIALKNSLHLELTNFKERFSDVFNKESALINLNLQIKEKEDEILLLRESYRNKKVTFDNLKHDAAIYDETIELAELGFYQPSFNFDQSDQYKNKIKRAKSDQKQMIKDETAVSCYTEWTIEGSKTKGKTFSRRNIRMTARAFNNECDAAIANVKWNNAAQMIERINKAYAAINKLNETNKVVIDKEYFELKISELKLTHEYHEKKQQEKEEQAEIRERMREESRLEKELEASIKEEGKYQSLLDKAQKQAQKSSGEKLSLLEEQIAKLNADLEQAHNKSERAKSMAEQTKVGHVYVISNEGSFGKDVYKIGMTRRLEPLDRVKELGDASVPFLFDVHAMIYTENAPELEKSLHTEFNLRRMNLVNTRKEFFNVSLQEIEQAVKNKDVEAEFYLTAEARQYKESEAIREQQAGLQRKAIEYPEAI